jgi:hypothetical protein
LNGWAAGKASGHGSSASTAMAEGRGSGQRRNARGRRAPAPYIGTCALGGKSRPIHGMGTAWRRTWERYGSGAVGGAAIWSARRGLWAHGANPSVCEHHTQKTKVWRKDRGSPACLGVRVRRRTAATDVERRATSSACARSRTETVPFSLV